MDNINTTTCAHQESFNKIDYELGKYYHRFGVSDYYNEDGRGIFMQTVIDEGLDDDETLLSIDDEFNKPTECAYVWGLMDNFPIPPYLNISDEKKEIFKFYIVYACFRNVSPSDKYIMNEIVPKVNNTNNEQLDDEKDEAESGYFSANNTNNKQYTKIENIIKQIECKIKPCIPLIKLAYYFFGTNNVQLMNDIKVRIMLQGFTRSICDIIIKDRKLDYALVNFIRSKMRHLDYNPKTFTPDEAEAINHLGTQRWYGYCEFQQMISDIFNKSVNCNEDYMIQFEVGVIQAMIVAMMRVIPQYLLTCKLENCIVVCIFQFPATGHGNYQPKTIEQYVDEFKRLFDRINIKEITQNAIICCEIDLSKMSDNMEKKIITENDLNNYVYFSCNMMVKKIFRHKNHIGVAFNKFGTNIQCYLHNMYKQSVIRFLLKDICSLWFTMLFKNRKYELKALSDVDSTQNCLDAEFDGIYTEFKRYIMRDRKYCDLFELIYSFKWIRTETFDGKFLNPFNQESMNKSLRDIVEPQFGPDSIEYLNMSTQFQLGRINIFTVRVDGKKVIFLLINNGLCDVRKRKLYSVIIKKYHSWQYAELVTQQQAFNKYGIFNEEIPKPIPALYKFQKKYFYPVHKDEIARKLNDFIQSWNANPKKLNLNFSYIYGILLDYYNNTQCRSKCCFKSFLNNRKCYIKSVAVTQLFDQIIQDDVDEKKADKMDVYLDQLTQEIKDESKGWKDMYVPKILNDKKMTIKFDNSFVNLHVYMQKWLFIYNHKKDCGIITKCQDSIRKASIVVTNFNFCNGIDLRYVVKETTLTLGKKYHYIISDKEIEEFYCTAKIPQTPKQYLIPDEKQQSNIGNTLKNIKERYDIINQLKTQYEQNELNVCGKKRKCTAAISYSWMEFIHELEESCGEKMKFIRLEPVLAFDQDGYEPCIEYVWVIPIKSKTNANECNHIGISVFLLNSECVASSLRLNIYDEQKLILIEPKDVFNPMDIEIENNDIPTRKHSHSKRKHSKAKNEYNKKQHKINNQSASQIIPPQLAQNPMLVQPTPPNDVAVHQTHLSHSAQPFTPANNPKSNDVLDTVDENSELIIINGNKSNND